VTAGKGANPIEARASALMEAVEHAVAEPQRTAWQGRRLSWGRLGDQFDDGIDLLDLVPRPGASVTRRTMVTTLACERLGRPGSIDLPAELVFYPYREPGRND